MRDYERVAEAIRFIRDHAEGQPELRDVADAVGLSPFHLQRLFRRWAGISPKRFLQYLTLRHARKLLRDSATVLETTWETGLSSPGRLHDLFVAAEAVTPGEFKRGGAGLSVAFGFHDSPFGRCLVATTERGVCALEFVDDTDDEARERLRTDWPGAELTEDHGETEAVAGEIFSFLRGEGRAPGLDVRGTNFQLQVWRALLRVPLGAAVDYAAVASAVDSSPRAVGGALAANRIALLIPCHRVLRGDGDLGGYRWGRSRKAALLGWESARRAGAAEGREERRAAGE